MGGAGLSSSGGLKGMGREVYNPGTARSVDRSTLREGIDLTMRRVLIALTLVLLITVSVGVGVVVADWPRLKDVLFATE
jgi:hypothetical protein